MKETNGRSKNTQFDFNLTIDKLYKKARSCRKRFNLFGSLMILMVVVFASYIMVIQLGEVQASRYNIEPVMKKLNDDRGESLKHLFEAQITDLMEKKFGLSNSRSQNEFQNTAELEQKRDALNNELGVAISNLKNISNLYTNNEAAVSNSKWASIASSTILSIGAVVFVVLFIQIAIRFMSYYARLAELYEAQADALRASDGDAEKAYRFIEHFSPSSIAFGSMPSTLYEKLLDTISTFSKR